MILIIDFGSQYNQLIARRVRELKVYCQIAPPGIPVSEIKALAPDGIILSGGPSSIYEPGSPKIDPAIFKLGVPILGICYGMHYMVDALGGKVSQDQKREYGFAVLNVEQTESLFKGVTDESQCCRTVPPAVPSRCSKSRTAAAAAGGSPVRTRRPLSPGYDRASSRSTRQRCSATRWPQNRLTRGPSRGDPDRTRRTRSANRRWDGN